MARPREFDREDALRRATTAFWRKGFAATSTEELLDAMGIGRQSLYNAFGDKRKLYLEVLQSYRERSIGGHLSRLHSTASPLAGLRKLLTGLADPDDETRALGCLGVGAVGEFGTSDPELLAQSSQAGAFLASSIVDRLREGQRLGEIDASLDVRKACALLQTVMTGLQVSARAGASVQAMHDVAQFAIDRLKAG
ncbi:MAG: TetR/AcrR family transcriptional regulator [Rhizobacter sp.]